MNLKRIAAKFAMAAVVLLCLGIVDAGAQQKKTYVGFGVNASCLSFDSETNWGAGMKLPITIGKVLRIVPSFTYIFSKEGSPFSAWDLSFDINALLPPGEKFRFYPLLGFGFFNTTNHVAMAYSDNYEGKDDHVAFNLGAGFEVDLSPHCAFGVEAKIKFIQDETPGMFSFGFIFR